MRADTQSEALSGACQMRRIRLICMIVVTCCVILACVALLFTPSIQFRYYSGITDSVIVRPRIVGETHGVYSLRASEAKAFVKELVANTYPATNVAIATGRNMDVYLLDRNGDCVCVCKVHPSRNMETRSALDTLIAIASRGSPVDDSRIQKMMSCSVSIERVY